MPHINFNGVDCHFSDTGRGEAVVLVHAGGSSSGQWHGVTAELADDYRVLAIDLYNCGKTGAWPGQDALRHDDDAVLLRALLDTLGEPAHLVGHSAGGSVSLLIARDADAPLRTLTLIEPDNFRLLRQAGQEALYQEPARVAEAFRAAHDSGRTAEGFQVFIDYHFSHEPGWDGLSEDARQRVLTVTDAVYAGLGAQMADDMPLADCARISVPTLLIAGEHTRPAYRALVDLLAEHIPGSISTTIPDAGHRSPVTQAPAVAAAIRGHLRGAT